MNRGERRARTERMATRRAKEAKRKGWPRCNSGRFKKRSPVCYCVMCQMARKPGPRKETDHA